MAGANNFKAVAVGGAANVITQAAYEALTTLIANGFVDGVADSAKINKVLRQAAFGTAVLGEIIAANDEDALDDGDLAAFKTKLIAALNASLSATVPDASTTAKGKVELATNAETISGLSDTLAVTPSGLEAKLAESPQKVKAWVNFNGSLSGTITPRESDGVASVTKNGTGDYSIAFSDAQPSADYVIITDFGGDTGSAYFTSNTAITAPTKTGFRFRCGTHNGAGVDAVRTNAAIIGS